MMYSQYNIADLKERELADYGFARVRDIAFDAVHALWRRRQAEGMKQKQVAEVIDRDAGWVSKNLKGPGNWTMRTFGEMVQALGGEVEIRVHAVEDDIQPRTNYDAYLGYSGFPQVQQIRVETQSSNSAVKLPERDLSPLRVY